NGRRTAARRSAAWTQFQWHVVQRQDAFLLRRSEEFESPRASLASSCGEKEIMPDYESGGGGSSPSGSTSGPPARMSPWRSRKARLLPKEQVARSSRAGDTGCS